MSGTAPVPAPGTEPAVLVAALILAGYRPWWLPPVVTPGAIRRGMLGGAS